MADDKNIYTVKINIEGVEAEAQRAGNSLDKNIGKAAKKVSKDLNINLRKTADISGMIKANFATLAGALGIQTIAQNFTNGVKSMAAFNLKMAETSTLLKGNARVSNEVSAALTDISSQFGKDKADLAAAYYDIVSAATSDAKKSVDLLAASTKLATVGVSDVETATGSILSVLNAYSGSNITAAEASDKLFSIVQAGRTNMRLLGASIGDVIPVASQLNIPLEEIGGFLAVATRISGNTAKTTTALTAALTSILKPADSVKELVKRLNHELGVNIDFSATSLSRQGLVGFLQGVIDSTSGIRNQVEVLTALFGSKKAVQAIMSVLGPNFLEFKSAVDQVSNSVGVLDEGMVKISDTLSFKFDVVVEKLKNRFGNLVEFIEPALIGALSLVDDLTYGLDYVIGLAGNVGRSAQDVVSSINSSIQGFTGVNILESLGISLDEKETSQIMSLPQKIEPVADSINKVGEAANNSAKAIFNMNAEASKTPEKFDPAIAASRNFHEQIVRMETNMMNMQKQVLAQGMTRAIQSFTKALIQGGDGFKNFGNSVLAIVGDMATQMGTFFITMAIPMKAMMSNPFTAPAAMLFGGAALIALGTLLSSFAGSGGSSAVTSTPATTINTNEELPEAPTVDDDELGPESIEKGQMVQVVVNGDILDNGQETATRIVNILNENFENTGSRTIYT